MIEREVIEFVAAADLTDDCRIRVELRKRVTKLTIAEAKTLRAELSAAIAEAERGAEEMLRQTNPAGFDVRLRQEAVFSGEFGASPQEGELGEWEGDQG